MLARIWKKSVAYFSHSGIWFLEPGLALWITILAICLNFINLAKEILIWLQDLLPMLSSFATCTILYKMGKPDKFG